jgi:hypothetical protein
MYFFILNKICYIYLLKSKDKDLKVHFKSEVKNLFIMKIKETRSHKDGKYDYLLMSFILNMV